jgi:hypothetical protein
MTGIFSYRIRGSPETLVQLKKDPFGFSTAFTSLCLTIERTRLMKICVKKIEKDAVKKSSCLRSGRAGLVTAPRLPLALEPPALCLPATGIHAPAKGRLCDDWYFFLQNPDFT